MVELGVNRGHYFPQENTNEGPTWINAWAETDSTQSRGQSTSNLKPTSKTTPTLLTKFTIN